MAEGHVTRRVSEGHPGRGASRVGYGISNADEKGCDPSGVTAALDGDELRLNALGETIQATLGDHTLTVRRVDLVVETRNFAIVRGEVAVIRITASSILH